MPNDVTRQKKGRCHSIQIRPFWRPGIGKTGANSGHTEIVLAALESEKAPVFPQWLRSKTDWHRLRFEVDWLLGRPNSLLESTLLYKRNNVGTGRLGFDQNEGQAGWIGTPYFGLVEQLDRRVRFPAVLFA